MAYLSTDEVSTMELLGSKVFQCILTEKGTADIRAVRKLKKLLLQGTSIVIYPEADRCWDGETDKLIPNLPQLVRIFNVPLYIAKMRGGYFTKPRWAKTERPGKILVQFDCLYPDQYKKMTNQQLYNYLSEKLHQNDQKDHALKKTEYKGKDLALGIENLLWLCVECGAHDSIRGLGDEIICQNCGAKWQIDAHLHLNPAPECGSNLQAWSFWQKEILRSKADKGGSDTIITQSSHIHMYQFAGFGPGIRYSGRKFKLYSPGNLLLYRDQFIFQAAAPQKKDLVFEIDKIHSFVEGLNERFNFHYQGMRFEVRKTHQNMMKYWYYFRYKQGFYQNNKKKE